MLLVKEIVPLETRHYIEKPSCKGTTYSPLIGGTMRFRSPLLNTTSKGAIF